MKFRSSMVATLIIRNDSIKVTARHYIDIAPPGTVVKFYAPKRTLPQNDKMWAMLTEVSQQATLRGNKKTPEKWKLIFMQACGHEIKFEEGLDEGVFFPIGHSSSRLSKNHMIQLIEFIYWFGAENGVVFNDIPQAPETAEG